MANGRLPSPGGAAYGVEVRLDDGRQVEVNLDADFNVIGQEADDDGTGDKGRCRRRLSSTAKSP
jgi:hypothetical protein